MELLFNIEFTERAKSDWKDDFLEMWVSMHNDEDVLAGNCSIPDLLNFCEKHRSCPAEVISIFIAQFNTVNAKKRWWWSKRRGEVINTFRGFSSPPPVMSTEKADALMCRDSMSAAEFLTYGWHDSELMLIYYLFKGRDLELPGPNTRKWLRRLARKEKSRGRGFKEHFLHNAYSFLTGLDFIPRGLKSSNTLEMERNPYWSYCRYWVDDVCGKKDSDSSSSVSIRRKIETVRVFSWFKAFEFSDTPTWISLTYDLCLLLLTTKLSNVSSEDVKLPMPLIHLEVPEGIFACRHKRQTEVVNTVGLFIDENLDGDDTLLLAAYSASSDPESEPDAITKLVSATLVKDGEPELKDCYVDPSSDKKFSVLGKAVSENEFSKKLLAFGINSVLYMNSLGEKKSGEKRSIERKAKKGKKGALSIGKYEQWVVGTSVKLNQRTRRALRSNAVGRKMTYAFTVRGHWANVACGKGRKERRPVWKKPYVKCKDLAERIVSHTYSVPAEEGNNE